MPKKVDMTKTGQEPFEGEFRAQFSPTHEWVEDRNGNDLLKIRWIVQEEPNVGRVVFDQYSMVPAALWRFKQDMQILGVDENLVGASSIDPEEIRKAAEGNEAIIVIVIDDTYDGKPRMKVKAVKDAGVGAWT